MEIDSLKISITLLIIDIFFFFCGGGDENVQKLDCNNGCTIQWKAKEKPHRIEYFKWASFMFCKINLNKAA